MSENAGYPNLLILSNNCLSLTDSNGRTLRNFLHGWPKAHIAQFYLQNALPDFSVCENYYRVTDRQALKAFLGKTEGCGKRILPEQAQSQGTGNSGKRKNRNACTMLLRDLVWNSKRWQTPQFRQWIEAFRPQVLLLQAGDSAFMFKLASDLSEEYDIPLVIYNSEVYYFKEHHYFRAGAFSRWIYPLFHRYFCSRAEKTILRAHTAIYACQAIQKLYDDRFARPSAAIYTATEVTPRPAAPDGTGFTVSYLGNLGVGRDAALITIANTLHKLDNTCYLDVYGKVPDDTVKAALEACPGIRYKGFVHYEDVIRVIYNSDLIVHAENFSDFYKKDLQYAFSTKIADSLASGTCFLLYAPETLACTQYLRENNAAYVASDEAQLEAVLSKLLSSPQAREAYLQNARQLVNRNHCGPDNARRFQDILIRAWKDGTAAAR